MNKRIKLLAEQAGGIFSPMTGRNLNNFNTVYFAELIVKECARIAFDEAAQAGRMNKRGKCLFGTMIGRRIEKDFGVEK